MVVLNVSDRRCDALVVRSFGVVAMPFSALSEAAAVDQANRFLAATETLSLRDLSEEARLGAEEVIREVCGWLWDVAV